MTDRQSPGLTIYGGAALAPFADGIAALVRDAFVRAYGRGDGEAALVSRLRSDGAVITELAAVEGGEVLGHAMFSRCGAEPALCSVAALGPVAVRHDRQRRGIGAALIRAGLGDCAREGIEAVVVLGDPVYCRRFGFRVELAKGLAGPYAGPHFQALELSAGALAPVRAVAYPDAFARLVG